jgi:hypothetical protein
MSGGLDAAIARMRVRQPADWVKAENSLSRFIADLPEGSRVLCRGVVRTSDRDLPAVLLYSGKSDDVAAFAADDPGDGIAVYGASLFWSRIPYEGIAREVLAGPEGTVAASGTLSRRAETTGSAGTESGPVGEAETPNLKGDPGPPGVRS